MGFVGGSCFCWEVFFCFVRIVFPSSENGTFCFLHLWSAQMWNWYRHWFLRIYVVQIRDLFQSGLFFCRLYVWVLTRIWRLMVFSTSCFWTAEVLNPKSRLLPSATRLLCDRYLNFIKVWFESVLNEWVGCHKKKLSHYLEFQFFQKVVRSLFLLTRPKCHRNVRTRSLALIDPSPFFLWSENWNDFLCTQLSQRPEESQRVVC